MAHLSDMACCHRAGQQTTATNWALLVLLKHQQTRTEVLQGQGTWASDLYISKVKCLLLLLAASGSLQTTYLHLRNSYLVLQTHQQFTLTQKNGLLSSKETMKKIIFFILFCQMSVKAFSERGLLNLFPCHIIYTAAIPERKQNKTWCTNANKSGFGPTCLNQKPASSSTGSGAETQSQIVPKISERLTFG